MFRKISAKIIPSLTHAWAKISNVWCSLTHPTALAHTDCRFVWKKCLQYCSFIVRINPVLYLSYNIYPENGCLTLEDPTQSPVISKREFPFPSKAYQFCFNCCSLIWIAMLFLERNTCLTPMLTLYYLPWQITCLLIGCSFLMSVHSSW